MARVLDAARARSATEAHSLQQQPGLTQRQRERTRRAGRIWERQRQAFLRLLVESMEEFGITQAELIDERRRLQFERAAPQAPAQPKPASP